MDTPLVNVNYLGAQAVTYCRQKAHRNAETLWPRLELVAELVYGNTRP